VRLPIPPPRLCHIMEAAPGFEPGIKVLQTSALPLGYAAAGKRKTGLEPATPTLARWCSTTELLPHRDRGWGSWIRTNASRSQSPLPYRLAIPQKNRRRGRLVGIEPTHARATIWCVNHFAIVAIHIYFMAGAVGIEPTPEVLETSVLPLNYAPSINGGGRIRTAEPKGSGFTVRRVWPLRYPSILWCRLQDLNPQPTDYDSVALPVELSRHISQKTLNLFIKE
jgi:hypothetical protein